MPTPPSVINRYYFTSSSPPCDRKIFVPYIAVNIVGKVMTYFMISQGTFFGTLYCQINGDALISAGGGGGGGFHEILK